MEQHKEKALKEKVLSSFGRLNICLGKAVRLSPFLGGFLEETLQAEMHDLLAGEEGGKVRHKALYNILGVNKDGIKEVLGMYIQKRERQLLAAGADLSAEQGLKNILIACTR